LTLLACKLIPHKLVRFRFTSLIYERLNHLGGGSDSHKRKKGVSQAQAIKKSKKCTEISDAVLAAQVEQVSAANVNDSLLQRTSDTKEIETGDGATPKKYFTTSFLDKRSSIWWEGFEQLVPSKHPTLYTEYVFCVSCAKTVKIGLSQSTSNLRSHKKYNHPEEYNSIVRQCNKANPQSTLPTSIKNSMLGLANSDNSYEESTT
jgi:hypothetical protein